MWPVWQVRAGPARRANMKPWAGAVRAGGRSTTTRRSRPRAGFTLLELAVAITIFVLGVLGFAQTMISLERAQLRTREAAKATQAAREILERIHAEAFPEAFRRYNGDLADDPGAAGTAPGKNFAVDGLSARAGDPDGLPGEVLFPCAANQPGRLAESAVDAALGMPRDLNGDGDTTDTMADNYRILPVRVRVAWTGPGGPGLVEIRTMLGNY